MFYSNRRASSNGRQLQTASYGGFPMTGSALGGAGSMANVQMNAISTYFQRSETLLRGIADEQEIAFRTFYRDIYRYDVVAGTAVDMMSVLPFSDFTLLGASDAQIDVFNKNINNLGLRTFFPEMSVDYYVSGRSISSMLFNNDETVFTDLMPHNPDNAEITPSPLYAEEPLIRVKVDGELKAFMQSRHPYFEKLRQRMPPEVLSELNSNSVVLDPLTTLFIPRRLTPRGTGTSLYRRLIPIYLLEKVLYRGTITEAARRQRAIGHISAGSQYWEPQDADLQAIVALFQQADLDPNGAIIATRNDVQYQDIRQGGDFWKWTDTTEQLTPMKMRALGINDALLSGEANISTQEASLSLFLEQLRTFRDTTTQRVFYDTLFPMVSIVNNMKGKKRVETGSMIQALDEETEDALLFRNVSDQNLVIPTVRWHKQLRPEADREYLDVLNTMAERGVPITLATWAAAGGIDLERQINDLQTDKKLREKIQSITGIIGGSAGGMGGPGGGDDDGGPDDSFRGSDAEKEVAAIMDTMTGDEVKAAIKIALGQDRVPILGRDFGGASEVIGSTRTGKPRAIYNQKGAVKKQQDQVIAALRRLRDPAHYKKVLTDAKRAQGKPPSGF